MMTQQRKSMSLTETETVKWFENIDKADFELVGGKGYNLSKMYRHGLNVPNGFVITTAVYDQFVAQNGLVETIDTVLASDQPTKEKSRLIKDHFRQYELSSNLETAILDAFNQFSRARVAVRSSATVEDLPGMSFAGQYSSYLNVMAQDLIAKVLLCWQSLWNVRAIDYRLKHNIHSQFSHAVVVQEMIDATVAGVIFTANPLNGIRDEILVNSAFGLGEAIVSGQVNPDQYRIDKENGRILAQEIAKKEIMCQYAQDGIESVPVAAAKQTQSSLSAAQLQTITSEAKKVQAYFGTPQDIEFAFDKDREFYLLQSREITSLFPIDAFDQDDKLRAYICANTVFLGMKEPFTPLGYDIFSEMFPTIINIMTAQKEPIDNSFVKQAAGRIYIDMTYLFSKNFIGRQFGKALSGNDLPLEDTVNKVIDDHGKQFSHQGFKFKIPWGVFKYGFNMMGPYREISKIPVAARYDAMKKLGEDLYQESKAKAATLTTVDERIAFSQSALVEAFKLSQKQALYCASFANMPKVEKKINKLYGDKFNTHLINLAFPDCITVELGMELNYLARFFAEAQIEPTADHPKMVEFLNKFGHRSSIELDFGVKRWSEDPSYVLNLIKSYMVDDMYARNIAEHEETTQQIDQLIEDLYQTMKVDKGERKAHKLKQQIEEVRIAAGMREYPKFNIVQMLALARTVMLEVGQQYQQEGLIDTARDIFFLRVADIRTKKDLRELVAKNKAAYEKEMARTNIPRIVLNTGETYYSAQKIDPNSNVLQGMPLSPGTYEGKIRVVFDPNNSQLQEGEILVTESTNPAWTPLFIAAKGLIMEYGGPVSHGGIVAREYGIPAVVGISSATERLRDGQMVRVNGETGTVEILS